MHPLFLRPATILVRPGNPGHITGVADLLKPGHRVLVVNGAGQQGLWEDVAGRLGDPMRLSDVQAWFKRELQPAETAMSLAGI